MWKTLRFWMYALRCQHTLRAQRQHASTALLQPINLRARVLRAISAAVLGMTVLMLSLRALQPHALRVPSQPINQLVRAIRATAAVERGLVMDIQFARLLPAPTVALVQTKQAAPAIKATLAVVHGRAVRTQCVPP